MLAIQNGHLAVAQWLLQQGFKSDYRLPPREYTLLHLAVLANNETTVKFCMDLGISPTIETVDGFTAMDLAEEKAGESVLKLLKRYGSVPEPIQKSSVQTSATEAEITVQLSPPLDNQVLMVIKRVEVSYKKSSLLAASTTVSLDLTETPSHDTVVLKLSDLSPDTTYKYKIRYQNSNGFSDWSASFDFQSASEQSEVASVEVQSRVTDRMCVEYENRSVSWVKVCEREISNL